MSKKGYNLIAYKQISGNRNNVLVLLYTFNTSVWSDGLQGRFTRWNLCSFRCQMCVFGVCVTCVSMQRWVWSRQSGGGAGRHNQALPVARPTAEDKNQTQWIQVHVLKKTIQSAEHLNISSEPHTDVDQWLLWTSPNLHLVTFFLSELWSHALWKHSFTSHALMNVICTASKNGRASPAALRH